MRPLRLAAAQLDFFVGEIHHNLELAISAVSRAREAGSDVVVLPELALTGYPPEDLLLRPSFVDANLGALADLAKEVYGLTAIAGFVDKESDLFNSLAVIADGEVRAVYHKQVLPNYTVFDEMRYFRPGTEPPPVFRIGEVPVGVAICEDAWSATGAIYQAGTRGAELVVVANASPFEAGRQGTRERLMAVRAADASAGVFYTNLVGGQDELVFDGGSFAVDASGRLLSRAQRFTEELFLVDYPARSDRYRKRLIDPRGVVMPPPSNSGGLRFAASGAARAPLPAAEAGAPVEEFDAAEAYSAIVLGTRDYLEKNRAPGVLVAVSGGIDSALVAALAVDAVGAEKVTLVSLPSRYSSPGSTEDALRLSENLGAPLVSIPIEEAHAAFAALLPAAYPCEGLVDENLQSRIRGVIMMALSNSSGKIVLTTGNKSELAVGYSTLYGDTAGGFGVIKDLYKSQVYAVAGCINARAGWERIPLAIIEKPPSAELRPDQLDTDSLPPYEVLDAVLAQLIDEDHSPEELAEEGFELDLCRRVARMVDMAEYKRRQSPIGVRLSHKAFGKDRRVPITSGKAGHL